MPQKFAKNHFTGHNTFMYHILWLIFYAAIAAAGPLKKQQAFEAVLGTSDPVELQRLVDNPQQWWGEREAQLFSEGRLKSHAEFIKLFTQQAKQRGKQLINALGSRKEWFCDLKLLEEHITAAVADRCEAALRAFTYADLCDHILFLITDGTKGSYFDYLISPTHFQACFRAAGGSSLLRKKTTDVLNKKMLWGVTKNGLFPMVDYLIILSKGLHLGSVLEDVHARDNYSVHQCGFIGHAGALTHDMAHFERFKIVLSVFQSNGVSIGEYIKQCVIRQNTHNLFEFAQRVLITFTNLHEFTNKNSTTLSEVLTPLAKHIPDSDLCKILPFFLDTKANVDELSEQVAQIPEEDSLPILLSWREKHLSSINEDYIRKSASS